MSADAASSAQQAIGVDEGSGPPLLIFHGWNGSSHNVLRWLPSLAPRFRVLVPDLPGCNGRPVLAETHTAHAYARFGRGVLDALGIDRAVVGGLCSGTAIAIALADAAPERVSGLLLHTPFIRPSLIRALVRLQLEALVSPAGALFGPLRRNTYLAMLHRRIFANAAEVSADQLAHDQSDLLGADVRAGRELAADLLRVDRSSAVARVGVPVAALIAGNDAFVDALATIATLRDLQPRADVEIFEGGHGWTPAYIGRQSLALEILGAKLRAAIDG